jgi:hypothetical protein
MAPGTDEARCRPTNSGSPCRVSLKSYSDGRGADVLVGAGSLAPALPCRFPEFANQRTKMPLRRARTQSSCSVASMPTDDYMGGILLHK